MQRFNMPSSPDHSGQKISDWLEAATSWPADNGALIQAIVEGQRPDNLLAFLAAELQDARFPQGLLEECAEVLGLEYSNELIRSVTPTNPTLRLGYFGEMVAATCLRDFDGCWIVVPKPSFAIDPNQSLPGTDVLAAFLNGGEIECLVFVEAKVRTSRSRSVVLQAARQSISDSQHEYASMIGFVVRRLYESHDQMHGPFLRYLRRRHDGASDDVPFVYLVLERGAWSDDDADLLDDLAPLPQGFRVSVVEIEKLAELVQESYARIGMAVDEHDDE